MYDLANWRRGRSVLLEIDDKLATADPAATGSGRFAGREMGE